MMAGDAVYLFVPPLLIIFARHCRWLEVWPLLRRLRWFFLSLLILGAAFPPGGDIGASLLYSLERIVILVLMVLAAHVLMSVTPLPQRVAALAWLLAPLARCGVATETFILRLNLVLESVTQVKTLYHLPARTPEKTGLQAWRARAEDLFEAVLQQAETTPLVVLEIPEPPPPPWWQWLYPLALGGAGYGIIYTFIRYL